MSELRTLSLDCSVVVADSLDIPAAVDERAVDDLVRFALEHERQAGRWVVNIAFVDNDEISRLHDQFLGDPSPTDIITFPSDESDWNGGDIAICVPVAAEQGPDHGKALDEELLFLILHGLLHLVGHDDATPELQTAMLDRQQAIYDSWLVVSR